MCQDLSMRLVLWRTNKKNSLRHYASVRLMALVVGQIMADELEIAVHNFRLNFAHVTVQKKMSDMEEHEQMVQAKHNALVSAGEDQLRSAALREMRAVLVRIAKGELAMRLSVWRMTV